MDNRINLANLSFRSVIIPQGAKKPVMRYLEQLQLCNLRAMDGKKTVEANYKELFKRLQNGYSNTGVILDGENGVLMRFLGYNVENDRYVYQQLKKIDKSVKYVNDIPQDGFYHGSFTIDA